MTVSPAAIVPFVRSLPSLLYQMGSSDNVTVEPALVAVSLALTFDAVPRPGLFVTLTLTETRWPSSTSDGLTLIVPTSTRRSGLMGASTWTVTSRVTFAEFGLLEPKPLSVTFRTTL